MGAGLVALLAALALLFAGFAFSRLWNFGDRGGRDLTVGALLALLVLAPYGVAAYWATIYPPLKDISTDLDDPPVLGSATQRTPDMNVLAPPTPGEQPAAGRKLSAGHRTRYDLPFDGGRPGRRNGARSARLATDRTVSPRSTGKARSPSTPWQRASFSACPPMLRSG